ncbi:hypothetical protein OHA99_11480 [Streptomyces coelicoflavus]|uniref:hypothetical protein n=1 Tax=Streptomyces TaxID=1883 RepID=UPI001290D51A|nr:hypothetical protein [Streptomyces sp. SYP-A7193]QFX81653.1 hypothetical protein GEV49_12465 [Streptomyces sp. SYP-A7193]
MSKKTEGDVARGLGQVAAASTGAAVGVAVGGPGGALVGAAVGPVLATGFEMAADRIAAHRAARRGELMSEVTRVLGIEANELQQRLLADERLLELAGRVVGAAQDISLAQKRRALSRALAAAVADPTPARLDIWELLQAAIREIDAPHIRFLHVISSAAPLPQPPEKPVDGVRYGMTLEQVCEIDSGLGLGGHAILQKLLSLGLIESSLHGVLWSGTHRPYALSGLGQRLMTLLESDSPPAS